MAASIQTAEPAVSWDRSAIDGGAAPAFVQYEARVWSCVEQREIPVRMLYSITEERRTKVYRLLFIRPLG